MPAARIVQLANRLEQEIRHGGLKPGDAYPTTAQVARRLGVSTEAANGALRVLVKRGILERRRRSGTIVARLPGDLSGAVLRRVHLLVKQDYLRLEGVLADGLVLGLQEKLPGAEIVFNFIPTIDGAEYANKLIAASLRSDERDGFVLVRASLAIQRLMQASGLPVVVYGSLQPSVQGMAWIDRDAFQIAELSFQHLVDQGCRQIVALFRPEMAPGDTLVLDGLLRLLDEHGFRSRDLAVRNLPADLEAVHHAASELLRGRQGPMGFLCRNPLLAEGVAAAAASLQLEEGRDLHIVVSDVYRKSTDPAPKYPHIRSVYSSEEIGLRLARMLVQQARSETLDPSHEVIPVSLHPALKE